MQQYHPFNSLKSNVHSPLSSVLEKKNSSFYKIHTCGSLELFQQSQLLAELERRLKIVNQNPSYYPEAGRGANVKY